MYKKDLICLLVIGVFCWTCLFCFAEPPPKEAPEMSFWMTGYTAEEGFTPEGGRTSNGTVVGYGTIAVDPGILPYGSIIYWSDYSNSTPGQHYGIALDSGSAVRGYHLDWWYETNAEAAKMTKTATVKILREGWDRWLVNPKDWGLEE